MKLLFLSSLLFAAAAIAQLPTCTDPGVNDNSSTRYACQGLVNTTTSQVTADHEAQQAGNKSNVGSAGAVSIPAGSTQYEGTGIYGAADNASVNTNGVGGTFYGLLSGNGIDGLSDAHRVRVWGFNSLLADRGWNHGLLLNELDYNITGPDTKVIGLSAVGSSTFSPAPGSAFQALGPIGAGGIHFPYGWICADSGAEVCFQLGTLTLSGFSNSQAFRMIGRNGLGVVNYADVYLGGGGGVFFNMTENAGAFRVQHNGVDAFLIPGGTGGVIPGNLAGTPLASLNAAPPPNFTVIGCADCVNGSNPCVAGGSGAIAKRLAGAWDCR